MGTDFTSAGAGNPTIPGRGAVYRWGNVGEGWEDFGQRLLENGPTGPVSKSVWDRFKFE